MIFITVGTQLPFDRMVRAVDGWAGRSGHCEVFGQIGPSGFRPRNMQWVQFLSADECRRRIQQASLVVAHAGMGSIITALELGKPILVMPRRADLGEHRNDHQVATTKWLSVQKRIGAAFDEDDLVRKLNEFDRIPAAERISSHASQRLVGVLHSFVNDPSPVPVEGLLQRLSSLLLRRRRRPVSPEHAAGATPELVVGA